MKAFEALRQVWSTTGFGSRDLQAFAERTILEETRQGLVTLGCVFLGLLLASVAVHAKLELGQAYLYTSLALAALCAHVCLSARTLREVRALNVLGMTLLIVSGTAFVLLAHQTGQFGAALFISVALLFMLVPMVPWGLREASLVTLGIYSLFSLSTWSVSQRFESETLWALQSLMLGAGCVSLILVGRAAGIRKQDLRTRFELERAHRDVQRLSLQDALTGAWNRRHLETAYPGFRERTRKAGEPFHFAICDVDAFKQLNDHFGHAHGDRVLQWIARALQTHAGDAGLLVRMGGDEFVLLLAGGEPEALFEQAISSVRALARAEGPVESAAIGLSVGLVEVPAGGEVPLDDAYLVADGALYRAKASRQSTGGPLHLARGELGAARGAEAAIP